MSQIVKSRTVALSEIDISRLKKIQESEGIHSRSETIRRLIDRAYLDYERRNNQAT